MRENLIRRFISYTETDTASDPSSGTFPSAAGQLKFAVLLAGELEALGLQDVDMDPNGYVTATIPSNMAGDVPVVGFVAHMDTSPDFSGKGVKPRILGNYDGRRILINGDKGIFLDPDEFPDLLNYVGQTLITTDGNTLLGADDKAGIAEIVTAAEILMASPEIKHGRIRLCFTPDEEIGRGADRFNLEKFGASFAFTLDGGEIGGLEYENFNAAHATLTIQGKSVHPGAAKGKMVNALLVAHTLNGMLPAHERPDNTEGFEGFFHLVSLTGNVDKAEIEYLIRDHDKDKFRKKKELLADIVSQINAAYCYSPVKLSVYDQYYNMREKIEPVMYVVDLAREAIIQAGVVPKMIAVRGGTDGARLSWMGLPCPNIFTGGHNYHGPYEYVVEESMVKAVEVILNICRNAPNIKMKSEK